MANLRIRPAWLIIAVSLAASLVALGAASALLIYQHSEGTADSPKVGPVDIGFAQDMSTHHGQAIEMAQIVGSSTDRPDAEGPDHATIVALASQIEAGQLEELGRLQGFLSLWDAPLSPVGAPMTWMSDAPGAHDMANDREMHLTSDKSGSAMPGLATQDEMQRLRTASGDQRDLLFLELMFRHHMSGVVMARYAADHAFLPQVQALAARMSFEQQAESDLMFRLLRQRGVDPRRAPAQ